MSEQTETTKVEETPAASEQPAQIEVVSETGPPKEQSQEAQPAAAEAKPEEPKSKPAGSGTVKGGYIQRQGLLWKKWNRQYMILEDGGSCLRFFKTENRKGSDGALFMKYCADVTEPKEGLQAIWPADTEGRCFVICSPKRAHYVVADSVEDKNDWMEKLGAAKDKFNTEGYTVIGTSLFSVEVLKHSLDSSAKGLEKEVDKNKKQENKTEGATPAAGESAQATPTEATPTEGEQKPKEEDKVKEVETTPPATEPKEAEPTVAEQQPEVAEQQPEVTEQPKEEGGETKAED